MWHSHLTTTCIIPAHVNFSLLDLSWPNMPWVNIKVVNMLGQQLGACCYNANHIMIYCEWVMVYPDAPDICSNIGPTNPTTLALCWSEACISAMAESQKNAQIPKYMTCWRADILFFHLLVWGVCVGNSGLRPHAPAGPAEPRPSMCEITFVPFQWRSQRGFGRRLWWAEFFVECTKFTQFVMWMNWFVCFCFRAWLFFSSLILMMYLQVFWDK